MAARLLLQGMIKRDPATRLGAWENPPQDIMSAPFFGGIQWDAIYERRFDGPFVPEVQSFGGSTRTKSTKSAAGTGTGNGGEEAGKNSGHGSSGGAGNNGSGSGKEGNKAQKGRDRGNSSSGDEDMEDEEEDSGSELKGMRDSVFIRPHDAGGNNLLDWSFIDEKVLAETCAEGDPSTAKGTKRKKKKRAPKLQQQQTGEGEVEGAATLNVSISEEIATNKVGFAVPSTGAAQIEESAGQEQGGDAVPAPSPAPAAVVGEEQPK